MNSWPNLHPSKGSFAERIAALLGAPADRVPNIVRFSRLEPGQLLPPHFDAKGRIDATVVLYFDTPDERDGDLLFPNSGMRVSPAPGRAVVFAVRDEHGKADPMGVHAVLPFVKGTRVSVAFGITLGDDVEFSAARSRAEWFSAGPHATPFTGKPEWTITWARAPLPSPRQRPLSSPLSSHFPAHEAADPLSNPFSVRALGSWSPSLQACCQAG